MRGEDLLFVDLGPGHARNSVSEFPRGSNKVPKAILRNRDNIVDDAIELSEQYWERRVRESDKIHCGTDNETYEAGGEE